NEVAQPADRALVPRTFRGLGKSARSQARVACRLASPHRVLFGHFEVEPQFLVHFRIPAFEDARKPNGPFSQLRFHDVPSESSVCMIPAMRVHAAFSASSCRRPAAVML